jgi:hypothetical protein
MLLDPGALPGSASDGAAMRSPAGGGPEAIPAGIPENPKRGAAELFLGVYFSSCLNRPGDVPVIFLKTCVK